MQLFYAPDIVPPEYVLDEDESKHCVRVLRLGVGDRLHITDGRGELHLCEITDANPKRCAVRVVSTEHEFERMPYRLIMAVAPTKNIERFEWFAEKATEVGVSEIIPIECAHSERRIIKREREEKVITAAVKQSLKAYHPLLHDMTPLRKVLDMPFDGRRFIAHCDRARGERVYFPKAIAPSENIMVLIGPEGDFSPEEITAAVERGFVEITLGHQRLRTETAAVVATVMAATANGE
ncbi:MAG TPA: 16S rRNA (uracil(1498)-N(3))-methyltransferase [Candidatus Alistipes excrementipullorum]|nr:16S rRNA (uracil(1498)-N(3))-methyltransferase [Candidatus Alistipes excrementipullorum]